MSKLRARVGTLTFGIDASIRYHAKRRAFFDVLHRTVLSVAFFAGSGSFVLIMKDHPSLAGVTSLLVVLVTTLDFVVGFSERARKHDDLYRRWSDLRADVAMTSIPSKETVSAWEAKRFSIQKDEPTALQVLNVICHNEEAEAQGIGPAERYKITRMQRLFAHFLSIGADNFQPLAGEKSPIPPDAIQRDRAESSR